MRLKSFRQQDLATQAVIDMKCYVNYYHKGTSRISMVYKEQEVNVDLDPGSSQETECSYQTQTLRKTATSIMVTGSYYIPVDAFSHREGSCKNRKDFSKSASKHQHTRRNALLHQEWQIQVKGRRKSEGYHCFSRYGGFRLC